MIMYPKFNAKEDKDKIVQFIKDWFDENGKEANAVIGISGGKDSTIVAALCVEALGKERVVGVLMPNGHQSDIEDSLKIVHHLGIRYKIVNIDKPFLGVEQNIIKGEGNLKVDTNVAQLQQNLAPRLRMATLYAVAQGIEHGGRVVNTCNRSEDYVGYSTKFGDSAGDVSPLGSYTVKEVLAIGDILDLPAELVHKPPSDGLCGKTDEDNFGFSYAVLDKYIMTGECEDIEVKYKIDRLHVLNLHKLQPLPMVNR